MDRPPRNLDSSRICWITSKGALQLRAFISQSDLEICVPLADVFHGAFDGRPVFCLLRRKAQVRFDTGSPRGELIVDLVCRKLSPLPAIAAAGRTSPLRNSEDPLDATHNPAPNAADDPANRTSHRAGRTIAGSSAFFRAENDALG